MKFARIRPQRRLLLLTLLAAALTAAPAAVRTSETADTAGAPPVLVETAPPARGTIVRRLDIVATLDPWEEAILYAKVSGYVGSIPVDRGDFVKKGDLIAVLDIPETQDEQTLLRARAQQAEAEVEESRAEVRLQGIALERLRAVLAEEPGAVTAQETDLASGKLEVARAALAAAESRLLVVRADLARTETLLAYGRITAPFAGIITERYVDHGALVTAGTGSKPSPVARLVDASRLRAILDVPESEIAHVRQGSAARLLVDALPGRTFEGRVSRFSRALDPASRTMRTEILIANPEGVLAAGMFGRVSLDLEKREGVITLAPGQLYFQDHKTHVFVAEDGRARRVEVVCGADDGNVVEVVSGLSGDEAVISKASATLADGVPVRLAGTGPAADGQGR